MVTIHSERPTEAAAREALLALAYGPSRFTKPSQRLREGRKPALALVAIEDGRLVGTVQLWSVALGAGRPVLLLGPLAVHPECRGRGIGAALMRRALHTARVAGNRAVLLVGDAAYYGRFGFTAEKAAALTMAGLGEPERLLALELTAGALDGACGPIRGEPRRPARPGAARMPAAQAA